MLFKYFCHSENNGLLYVQYSSFHKDKVPIKSDSSFFLDCCQLPTFMCVCVKVTVSFSEKKNCLLYRVSTVISQNRVFLAGLSIIPVSFKMTCKFKIALLVAKGKMRKITKKSTQK